MITGLDLYKERNMPHRTRPMPALLLFTGLNAVLCLTITPVYDFVCFHPYWERRPMISILELAFSECSKPEAIQHVGFVYRFCMGLRERRRQEREAALVNSSSRVRGGVQMLKTTQRGHDPSGVQEVSGRVPHPWSWMADSIPKNQIFRFVLLGLA
ncbi:hypothetical protein Lal_00033306 [Lupinus albus]|nr:hypothetical protein Lal_00033306 [Lupinus albus]